MLTTSPPTAPPPAAVLSALWLELRTRAPVERVGFLHVVLVSAATRSFAAAAADLTGDARPALAAAAAHAVVAAAVTLVDLFGDGEESVRALQNVWDAVSAELLLPAPHDRAPAGVGGHHDLPGFEDRVRLPVLAGIQPTLPRDPLYRTLSPDAQLLLLALAGETGYARAVWELGVVGVRTGPLLPPVAEAGLAALVRGGWVVRSDWGDAPEGRGRVLSVNPRVLLGIAGGPWGSRTPRRAAPRVRPRP